MMPASTLAMRQRDRRRYDVTLMRRRAAARHTRRWRVLLDIRCLLTARC